MWKGLYLVKGKQLFTKTRWQFVMNLVIQKIILLFSYQACPVERVSLTSSVLPILYTCMHDQQIDAVLRCFGRATSEP